MIKYIAKPFQIFWNIDSSFFTTIERSRKYTSPIARNIIKENHFIPYIYYTNTWYKPFLNLDIAISHGHRWKWSKIITIDRWWAENRISETISSRKYFNLSFCSRNTLGAPSFIYPDSGTTEGFQRYRGRNDRMNRTT